MANMFGLPTPEEVAAGVRQERQQQLGQNSPFARGSAIGSILADQILGNPQVKAAQAKNQMVARAMASAPAGASDLETEISKMTSVRDALVEAGDIDRANAVQNHMLQLGQQLMEQRKLQADTERVQAEEARKKELHPLEVATAKTNLATKANEGQNYWRNAGGTIQRINVGALDSIERKRLRNEGWVEGSGPNTEAEANDALGLTKPVQTDLQTAVFNSQQMLDQLGGIAEKYDPEFVKLPNQLINAGSSILEKVTGMTVGDTDKLKRYYEFRRNAKDGFNQYIKSITGAAMSNAEAGRIQEGFPDAEKDPHTKFMSKLREVTKQTMAINKRAMQALQVGLVVNGDQWNKIAVPPVSDAEVDAFMEKQFGIPSRASSSKASADGWTTINGVRVRKKQ